MNIAIAINRKYVSYACVMLQSVFSTNQDEKIQIFVLQDELQKQDKEKLEQFVHQNGHNITFLQVNPDSFDDRIPVSEEWSREAFYRLALLDLLPDTIDRLLYLDVDIIVRKPLAEIYGMDFEHKMLIACRDTGSMETFQDTDIRKEVFREFPTGENMGYFNSGMMLMNITGLREHYSLQKYMEILQKMQFRLFAPDQDILNYAHWYEVKLIETKKYDFFVSHILFFREFTEELAEEAVILHYAGSKPWKDGLQTKVSRFWWENAKKTEDYEKLLEEYVNDVIKNRRITRTVLRLDEENVQLNKEYNMYRQLLNIKSQ